MWDAWFYLAFVHSDTPACFTASKWANVLCDEFSKCKNCDLQVSVRDTQVFKGQNGYSAAVHFPVCVKDSTSARRCVLLDVTPDPWTNMTRPISRPSPILYLCLPLLSPPAAIFLPALLFGKIILPLHSAGKEWSKGVYRGRTRGATDCSYCLRMRLEAS